MVVRWVCVYWNIIFLRILLLNAISQQTEKVTLYLIDAIVFEKYND